MPGKILDKPPTSHPFPCLLQSQAQLPKTLDSNCGKDPFAALKMRVQDGLAVGDFVGQSTNSYVGPPFTFRDSSSGTDDLCSAGLLVAQLSIRNEVICQRLYPS